jgi:hypothetical protein
MKRLPAVLRKSMTYDRGSEMACHPELARRLKIDIWFCDPHAHRPRGSNENTNGLLRQVFPKGTDLSTISQTELNDVARLMNNRPRKTLGWTTHAEAMVEELAAIKSTAALQTLIQSSCKVKAANGGTSCGGGQRSFRVFTLRECAVSDLAQQAGIMVQRADRAACMDGPCWASTNSDLASGVSWPCIRRPFADATLRTLKKSACIRSHQLNAIWSLGVTRGVPIRPLPVSITSLSPCRLVDRASPGAFLESDHGGH